MYKETIKEFREKFGDFSGQVEGVSPVVTEDTTLEEIEQFLLSALSQERERVLSEITKTLEEEREYHVQQATMPSNQDWIKHDAIATVLKRLLSELKKTGDE